MKETKSLPPYLTTVEAEYNRAQREAHQQAIEEEIDLKERGREEIRATQQLATLRRRLRQLYQALTNEQTQIDQAIGADADIDYEYERGQADTLVAVRARLRPLTKDEG